MARIPELFGGWDDYKTVMRPFLVTLFALLTVAAGAATDFRELSWDELVPEGYWEQQMEQM